MAYADKPKLPAGGAPDALVIMGEGAEGGAPDGEHEAKLDAAQRQIDAFQAGDAEALVSAQSDFVRICMRKYS
jgi:hypothetical protein